MSKNLCGFYNFALGYYTRIISVDPCQIIDNLNIKMNRHDRLVSQELPKVWTLTQYIEKIFMKIEGLKSREQFDIDSSCT